ALIGDAERGDVATARPRPPHGLPEHGQRHAPDLVRVVLDPSRPRVVLRELLIGTARDASVPVEDQDGRARRPLIDRGDEAHRVRRRRGRAAARPLRSRALAGAREAASRAAPRGAHRAPDPTPAYSSRAERRHRGAIWWEEAAAWASPESTAGR